ncbi:hypothetical protein BJ944DRAFT_267119 [Cunninghamella echinulata]|nr:hypothetical protein BJ944DRAFT_267119 [Cunninghamella echinulata]
MDPSQKITISQISNDIVTIKSFDLNLIKWQQEYNEKLGLTEAKDTDENIIDLPLHPETLKIELDHYKEYVEKLNVNYIALGTKLKFLITILDDPPKNIEQGEVEKLVRSNFLLQQELKHSKSNIEALKSTISKLNYLNDKSRQALNIRIDEITKILDDIHEKESELNEINAILKRYTSTLTPEESIAILNKQSKELSDINQMIDIKRDSIAELTYQLDDQQQEIDELEKKLQIVEAQAKEAVEKSKLRDENVEERFLWYTQTTESCNNMFGIEDITFDYEAQIKVAYITKDQLIIQLEPLTQRVSKVLINNDKIKVNDLEAMVKGVHIKDVGSTIIFEVLARLVGL